MNAAQQSVNEIKDISFQKTKIYRMEIALEIEGAIGYEIIELNEPKKLAIEFSPIQKISVQPWYEIQDTRLVNVKVEMARLKVARVVFEFVDRTPVFNVTPVSDGFQIELLFEETVKMELEQEEVEPAETEPVEIEAKPVKTETKAKAKRTASDETPSRKSPPNYYVLLKYGLGRIITSDIHVDNSFQLYAESATLAEHYRLDQGFIFDAVVGRLFTIKNIDFKASFGFSSWTFKNDGKFEFSLPHPFISNNPRTLDFVENNNGSHLALYITPQISITKQGHFQLWAGPIIGYSQAKLTTLQDVDISDSSPFTSADVAIVSESFVEEELSSLWWGLSASLEYRFYPPLSLLLEINYINFSPDSPNMGQKVDLSRYQLFLGLQLYF